MLASDRPMALLIIRVSRMPEAPTRVPAMISRLLSSVKPEAATARPVKELSSEMSTGTSAPPMGRTKMTPRTSDEHRTMHQQGGVGRDHGGDDQGHDGQADDGVDRLLGRIGDGPAGHELLQLGEGDAAAGEGDAPDQDAEEDLDDLVDGERLARQRDELGDRYQGGGAAPHAVEDGHHLGHGRHLHDAGRRHADGGADHHGHEVRTRLGVGP